MFPNQSKIRKKLFPSHPRHWRKLAGWGIGGLGLIGMAIACPCRLGIVVGHSMEPTLPPGSLFIYDQSYYRNHPLRAGEVVVVRQQREIWIKRVYATAGTEFWSLRQGSSRDFRHDPIRAEQVGRFKRATHYLRQWLGAEYQLVALRVPDDCVYLVGDGFTSVDSRQNGPVQVDHILGRVLALPWQRLGSIPEWVELSSPHSREPGRTERTEGAQLTPARPPVTPVYPG